MREAHGVVVRLGEVNSISRTYFVFGNTVVLLFPDALVRH